VFAIGILVGLIAYFSYLATRSSFRVDEGHAGILTTLGKAVREKDEPKRLKLYPPGLHFKLPWQQARSIPLMEEIIDLSGAEGARTAMAQDGTTLRLDAVLRYMPVSDELYNFVFDMTAPKEHITSLFTCMLRNEIANFGVTDVSSDALKDTPGGSYALLQRERERLNDGIMTYCKTEIGSQYGIRFSAVDLVDIRPPEELDEALNAAVHAQMQAETSYSHAEAPRRTPRYRITSRGRDCRNGCARRRGRNEHSRGPTDEA
jgi:regulator of protease activity HflC (stomatin/prohibitin superfamily)